MRFIALLSFLLTLPASQALSQSPEAVGQARVVSLFVYVQTECGKYYVIDRQLVDQFAVASAYLGQQTFGKAKFKPVFDAELKRRGREVAATGPQMWCKYQRPNLEALGVKAFLD